MKIQAKKIDSITVKHYDGFVYNVEVKSLDQENDDLFWIVNDVLTHNCFIKDLNALMSLSKTLGINPSTMNGAWEKNLEVRPQRDWEKLLGRAVSKK